MSEHFEFSPEILKRLGEELVPSFDQGIIELVRNSYDADADNCTIELYDTDLSGGEIRLKDDGEGMNGDALKNRWLVLGRSEKQTLRPTKRHGRIPVGDKGLGRLAALRMGRYVELRTRPKAEPGTEYALKIDWEDFDRAKLVSDVGLTIEKRTTLQKHGTEIILQSLRAPLTEADHERLARSVLLITGPFESQSDFSVVVNSPHYKDLTRKARRAYFDQATYRLTVSLSDGAARFTLMDEKGKRIASSRADRKYATGDAKFELWSFNLSGRGLSVRDVPLRDLREWLSIFGGIYIFERGMRVHPYGGVGTPDWLGLNLLRSQSPEERPSTNNTVARIVISDRRSLLRQKTDRSGYIETVEFLELKQLAIDALNWMASERLKVAEGRRESIRQEVNLRRRLLNRKIDAVESRLETAIATGKSKEVREVFSEIRELAMTGTQQFREDLQIYRTLATIGTTVAVFAHEASKPILQVRRYARIVRSDIPASLLAKLTVAFDKIESATKRLQYFASLSIQLMRKEKRQLSTIDINDSIQRSFDLFSEILDQHAIKVEVQKSSKPAMIDASPATIEGIVTNLITNSITAFQSSNSSARRTIRATVAAEGKSVLLTFMDSGPGIDIKKIPLRDIWLLGKTTSERGTGLGLTIVRDSVVDLGGRVNARSNSELGGAQFEIILPVTD